MMPAKPKPQPETDPLEELAPDGFIMIRAGIREHISSGRLVGYDAGVYLFLHTFATWRTGICYTNAVTIANAYQIPTTSVNASLARLRAIQWINYPKGDGHRGSYPVAINKYRPTVGVLKGYELDAFTHKQLGYFAYHKPNGDRVLTRWSSCGHRADVVLMSCGHRVDLLP